MPRERRRGKRCPTAGRARHSHLARRRRPACVPVEGRESSCARRAFDNIGAYALAAWYAHLLALPETSEKDLEKLNEEAIPLREDLLVAAEALAHKGYLDTKSVEAIRTGQGNIDRANDLVALAALFTREWEKVKHKTTVEWAEVERAAVLGPQILVALGVRDQPGIKATDPASPTERRARAYTLFVTAYDECRRAVCYLRWHEDDADLIAPSLFATRTHGSGPANDQPPPADAAAPAAADKPAAR